MLGHYRCPDSPEFSGSLPPLLAEAWTVHWFDPCALLADDARSEYRPEFRERQPAGGWQMKGCGTRKDTSSSRALQRSRLAMNSDPVPASEWWSGRRRLYNVALLIAGFLAFLAYAVVLETRCAPAPDVEITIFTAAVQGVGYLVAMAIANLFYNLGSWSETRLRPRDVSRYRRWTWGIGVGFSVVLPFTLPVLVAVSRCRPM